MAFLWFDCYWSLIIHILLGTESILYKKTEKQACISLFFCKYQGGFYVKPTILLWIKKGYLLLLCLYTCGLRSEFVDVVFICFCIC